LQTLVQLDTNLQKPLPTFFLCAWPRLVHYIVGVNQRTQTSLVITRGTSSQKKRGLSRKSSFWYYFSA